MTETIVQSRDESASVAPPRESTRHELVSGYVAPGWEAVREAFAVNMRSGLEVGATFAVVRRHELVVDLWGGHADAARTTLLQRDALFNLFSTTKGLAATCIAMLVERGKLSYETAVADYWPEFAAAGKRSVTVGQLMSHRAGVCGAREPVTIEDFFEHTRLASLLAQQAPFFEPGSVWGYHALTIATLTDELCRRVDGRTINAYFAEEIAAPLQLDAFLGLPIDEDHRQVPMIPPPALQTRTFDLPNPEAFKATCENPVFDPSWPNHRSWRAAGLASAGGSANARSLARFYAVLANGGAYDGRQLLARETIAAATRERIAGIDQVVGMYDRYAAGFRLNLNGNMGAQPRSFGHPGWGGSLAYGDPQHGLGVAYVMNQMHIPDWGHSDPRVARLLAATDSALEHLEP